MSIRLAPGRYVVTGGGGFVGRAIVKALRDRGLAVTTIARGAYPDLADLGAETVRADLSSDAQSWSGSFRGAAGVFHVAAKVEMWGPLEEFMRVNVTGTRNVVAACRDHGVSSLVFTSSPSVVADGTNLRGIDESYPYPGHYEAHYPRTKAMAEREILAGDGQSGLRTTALRPHLIWGPGDTNLVPHILDRSRAGRLVQVGDGKNLIDLSYIDDCVQAHLRGMSALQHDPDSVGGKAYFISQGEPVSMWWWINQVLDRHGLPPVSRTVPKNVAMTVATACEFGSKMLDLIGLDREPILTRFLVSEMATDHYFSIARAERDFGYRPSVSIREALDRAFSPSASVDQCCAG